MTMRKIILLLLISAIADASFANVVTIDRSYQAEKRLQQYRKKQPELQRPNLVFNQGQQVEFNLSYHKLDKRWLMVDVFYPDRRSDDKDKPVNLIVLIHGGGWRSGDKSLMYPIANMLAQQGHLVIVPEYRLSVEAKYPAALNDLVTAINWGDNKLRTLNYRKNKTVLLGGSSGGHLASLIGFASNDVSHPSNQLTTKIDAVINLDGLLSTVSEQAILFEDKKKQHSALALWLGGSYQQQTELWRTVSPTLYLDVNDPKILVIGSGQARFTAGKELLYQLDSSRFSIFELDNAVHTFWLFEPYLQQIKPKINDFMTSLNKKL